MIGKYLENIAKIIIHEDQREESFYHAVRSLMIEFAQSIKKKKVSVTILPKKTKAGNPDFRIWDGNNKIIGYIEAKLPNTNLDRAEDSEQLKRYLKTFPNVILTDFYEFRLYRNGNMIKKVIIGKPSIAQKLKTTPPVENEERIIELLKQFFSFSLSKIFTIENVALELAKRTQFLRDEIVSIELQKGDKKNHIRRLYNAFKKYLIAGLKETEFADLYSQTITYGMFVAKTRTKKNQNFNRKNIVNNIPPTIGILRDVFEFISLGKLPQQMEVIIDDIAEVLNVSDTAKLFNNFYKQGKGSDPIIHFHETFLNKYNPSTRERGGVYYTPEPVAKYIVNSVNDILKKDFNKIGFADTSVKVLDPVGGTLTFLAEATKKSIQTFIEYYGYGHKNSFIKHHILKNFYGFELMMSNYTIAHLKMHYLLQEELGYTFENNDRFQLYLTNTLDPKIADIPELPGLSSLAEESIEANIIKKETPVLAIIGNPLFSISSYNKSDFETELMRLYKKDIKDERNIKIFSEDYIKFIRYCHWKIEQSGFGVIGLITKNTYLNIAAAKGLRKQLLLTFDKIYILNLHGKLYEKTPDGGKDQNVFDIREGIAIMFLVKTRRKKNTTFGKLYYKDIFGDRDFKYDYLYKNDIFKSFTKYDEITIDENHFLFEKKNFQNPELYNSFWAIDEIFVIKSSGVTSGRDHFILGDSIEILKRRLNTFIAFSAKLIKKTYKIDDSWDFNLLKVKEQFKEIDNTKFLKYAHKPFSKKYIYYDNSFIDRDRKSVMKYFRYDTNLGLILKRRYVNKNFTNCFVSENIVDLNFLGGGSYVFPLWINRSIEDVKSDMYDKRKKISNLNTDFEKLLVTTYNKENITEDIFYYIYAVLHSNTFRISFPELLKIGFPKIPITKNVDVFNKLLELGKELVDLHLLKSKRINKPKVKFQGEGNGKVENPKFIEKNKIIKINDTQYFANISKKLWEFKVGNNQVIKQWIRKKRIIEFDDAMEFIRIAMAIYETLKLQNEIDKIYPEILTDLIEKRND